MSSPAQFPKKWLDSENIATLLNHLTPPPHQPKIEYFNIFTIEGGGSPKNFLRGAPLKQNHMKDQEVQAKGLLMYMQKLLLSDQIKF